MLHWAIVGTSFISETMARAIAKSPGSMTTVVIGRDPERLEAFRSRHNVARSSLDLEAAIAEADVDIVYVGTPNHVHHEATVAAARAGKAVLSEKSLTVSMDQADALAAAVRGNVFFVEGLMYLAHPVIARFVEVLRGGLLGTLKAIDASYAADIAHLVNPAGRGAIFNLGCYPASLVQLALGTLSDDRAFVDFELSAFGHTTARDANVCETATTVRFGNGVLANIHTAETYGNSSRFELHGTKGTLTFITNPWLPNVGKNSFVWHGFDGTSETFVVDDPFDAFDHQVRMVEANLTAGRTEALRPSPRLDDSLDVMRFLTEWERSAISNR